MSTWYQYTITVFGSDSSIGKLFNIDASDVHYIGSFDFSFGGKNGPGFRYEKVIKANPDLIFFVNQSIESAYFCLWVEKYDPPTNSFKRIVVENSDGEINKKLLQEYAKKFPYLMEQHKQGRPYEWKMFFHSVNLHEYFKYEEAFVDMILPASEEDMVFDNQPLDEA